MKKFIIISFFITAIYSIYLGGCGSSSVSTTQTITPTPGQPIATKTPSNTQTSPVLGTYISSNDGLNFIQSENVYIKNLSAKGVVDPAAFLLDNKNIRLYYFGSFSTSGDPVSSQPDGINRFYCAVSEDGYNFTEEKQVISNEDRKEYKISDPFVIKNKNGLYIMFISFGGNILSARSSDGLNFTWDSGTRTIKGGVPGALLLSDGKIRLYYHNSNGIKSAKSTDPEGLNFVEEEGFRINPPGGNYSMAGDPNPIKIRENYYLMCYKKRPVNTQDPSKDEIFIAKSTDQGYNWTEISTSPITTGSVPTMIKDKNGNIFLYTTHKMKLP